MFELTDEQVNEVAGGKNILMMFAEFAAGYVGGKIIDAVDKALSSPGAVFESTPALDAVAAGNMTA